MVKPYSLHCCIFIPCIPSRKLRLVPAKNETEVHVASVSIRASVDKPHKREIQEPGLSGPRLHVALADAYRMQKAAAR